MQSELKRLRKENKRLQMEREILRKAAAFFANVSVKRSKKFKVTTDSKHDLDLPVAPGSRVSRGSGREFVSS